MKLDLKIKIILKVEDCFNLAYQSDLEENVIVDEALFPVVDSRQVW